MCRCIPAVSSGRPARHEFTTAILPRVFPTAAAATAYLISLSMKDDREARQFLLEAEGEGSRSGESDDTTGGHDEGMFIVTDDAISAEPTAIESTQ